jgi:hypothetical protein
MYDEKCKNINECEREIDDCDENSKCIDTVGSFQCLCVRGELIPGISCDSSENVIQER